MVKVTHLNGNSRCGEYLSWSKVTVTLQLELNLLVVKNNTEVSFDGRSLHPGIKINHIADITNSTINIIEDPKSKREHVFHVGTNEIGEGGRSKSSEFFFQAGNRNLMIIWVHSIAQCSQQESLIPGFSLSYQREQQPDETIRPSDTKLNIIRRMRNYLRDRPKNSTEITKTCYPLPLEKCIGSTFNFNVPNYVETFVTIIEKYGLNTQYIYGVPGNKRIVTEIKSALELGSDVDETMRSFRVMGTPGNTPGDEDIHIAASLLKEFIRELPDSLMTSSRYQAFMDCSLIQSKSLQLRTVKKLILDLPEPHYETLKYLMVHLVRVASHCLTNRMGVRQLAIIFAPTIFIGAELDDITSPSDGHQAYIVSLILIHYSFIFNTFATTV